MVSFVRPKYTKSKIKAAGKRSAKLAPTLEDSIVVENFRASHAYVLNTFQMNARRHSAGVERTVGQRLKRRNTIIDKLRREPSMPLHAMQDIAGCRLIFQSQKDLYDVRSSLRDARFSHKRLNDADKYDYIKNPKSTGYRGVHDIYEYTVMKEPGSAWNGLRAEIQFRTQPQHAWATAVEVADLITSSRIKFNDAKQNYLRYFQLSSEIIARTSEGQRSCCGELTDKSLRKEFISAEKRLGILGTLNNLRQIDSKRQRFKKNMLLIFKFDAEESERLETKVFENINQAIEAYDRLEKAYGDLADIVLVRGETEENIRDAFRNYFSDARAFVDLVNDGLKNL